MNSPYYIFCSLRYDFGMTAKRGYGEACPVAHSLDVIGDRWAMLLIRELRLGPRRFTDLQDGLRNAGPTVLSQRLRDLEKNGVLRRRTLPPPASAKVYELTDWGAELEPVFRALARWGMRSPNPREGDLTNDTVMLGLRTFWQSKPGWTATLQLNLGRDSYRLSIVDGDLVSLSRGEAERPDATITTDRTTFNLVSAKEMPLAEALKRGTLRIDGEAEMARPLLQ